MQTTLSGQTTFDLRQAALQALRDEEQLREAEVRRRRENDVRQLARCLRQIVGAQYEIAIDPHFNFNGAARVIATIDGIRFALSHQITDDPYSLVYVGVCQRCQQLAVSEAIGELSEIGEQLTRFRADNYSHRCPSH